MGPGSAWWLRARPGFGLLVLCFLIRLAAFSESKNFSYDAVIRTEIAQAWSTTPFLILPPDTHFPPQYSPLPIYLYGLGLKLVHNPLIVPRLISLFWGTLTLIPFYFFMEIIYDSRIAKISSLFFCAYTLSIKSAVVASSESIFCFFLLMAIWRLYVYKSCRCGHDLLLAVIFMNLACMSRYNGWFYIPLLTLLLPGNWRDISRRDIGGILCFGLGSLILPLLWMYGCQRFYGDFLYPINFIFADHLRIITRIGAAWSSWYNKLYLFFFLPGVLFLSLTPPIMILAIMGIKGAGKFRWGLHPLVLAIVPSAFIFFRVLILGNFFPLARFITDSGIFLLGYAALGYVKIFDQVQNKQRVPAIVGGLVVFSVFVLVMVGLSDIPKISSKIKTVSPLARLEPTQEKISSYLKTRMGKEGLVVLDSYRIWSEEEIIFYSGHPRSRFFTRWHRQNRLIEWIRNMKPRFLVTGPGGRAWGLIQNEDIWSQLGARPILLHKAGKQNIYRFKPIGEPV